MNHTTRSAKAPSLRTGFFATLSNLFRGGGSGAPSARRPKLLALPAALLLGVSLASTALAAVDANQASAAEACPNEALRAENWSLALPDCRAYEQISPPENGEVFAPEATQPKATAQTVTKRPMQSSPNGDSIAFIGEPPASGQGEGTGGAGKPGSGDERFATRGGGGWASTDIAPLGRPALFSHYVGFNEDLSHGFLATKGGPSESPLNRNVQSPCEYPRGLLYARSTAPGAEYQPFFTSVPCGQPFFVGSSTDGSQVFFESMEALTPGAQAGPEPEGEQEGHDNLYELSGGALHLVNVLPGAAPTPAPNSSLGSLPGEPALNTEPRTPALDTGGAISADGSHVFWTDLATGIVYLRENPISTESCSVPGEAGKACTIQVSIGEAEYWAATPDGRYAYYTEEGELWRFDSSTGVRTPIAGAGVLGVIGVNEIDEPGSYLYFVATGALASNENGNHETPSAGQPNLYLDHAGQITFLATLAPKDNEFFLSGFANPVRGDWAPVLGYRTAQLNPDGRHLLFTSERRLTSYDNVNREHGCGAEKEGGSEHACAEIYLYDAGGGNVSCVSCDPSGAPPVSSRNGTEPGVLPQEGETSGNATYLPFALGSITRAPRAISLDGSRVFFVTDQPLLAADRNEQRDVYEWERAGTGSCSQGSPVNGGGCIYLLSGGISSEFSSLIEADRGGNNVFLVTRAALAPSDGDGKPDLYDVRVNGGFPVPSELICEAAACKGQIPPVPLVQTPGTSSFEAREPQPNCRKGFVRKQAKCVKKRHHKRSHRQDANTNRRIGR